MWSQPSPRMKHYLRIDSVGGTYALIRTQTDSNLCVVGDSFSAFVVIEIPETYSPT